MVKFTVKGKEFKIDLTVGLLEDIKDGTGVELDKLWEEPENFANFITANYRKYMEILYVILEDQIKGYNLDPRGFARLFGREELDISVNALLEASVLFCQRSPAGRAISGKLPQILKQMDEKIEREVNRKLDGVLSNTHTDSPVSSGSTPAPTLFDN